MAAASQPTNTRTIAVIDGNSLMHRAFHAVPPTMNAPDGAPTNAVFGFISMFIKMVETLKPDAVICAFDAGRPAFRMEALERYKAQRPPMDENLKVQFPLIERLLKAMGIPVVKVPGWEGDDILGTLSLKGEQEGDQVLLVTGDKDIFQLASSQVKIVSTRKGITDVAVYGPAEVQERYGVTPDLVPDFLGLKGDPSDNIPGVPGVGEKTAAKLIQQYGGLDSIYAHADEIKGKLGEKVRDNEDAARTSKLVATIRRDVPIDLDPDLVTWPSFDPNEVRQAFGELRFTAHLNKVLALGEQDGNDTCETSADGRRALGSAADGATVVIEPVVEGDEAQQLLDDACDQGLWLGVGLEEGDGAELFGERFCHADQCGLGSRICDFTARSDFSPHTGNQNHRPLFPFNHGGQGLFQYTIGTAQIDVKDDTPNPYELQYTQEFKNMVMEQGGMSCVGFGYTVKRISYK